MATELENLRERSEELSDRLGDTESLEVNAAILKLDPVDAGAIKRLGIGLLKHARPTEALEVLQAGLLVYPEDSIMLNRKAQAERAISRLTRTGARKPRTGHSSSTAGTAWTDFEPAELVEVALDGPGRDASVRLCAASIRRAEEIDQSRTAVTPIKDGPRFRVIGGILTGVAPEKKNLLSVAVPQASRSLIRAVETVGGYAIGPAVAVPCVELLVPRRHVAELFDDLFRAHDQHLRLSIEYGPPTHQNQHHPGLRRYLLEQADLLEGR